MKAAQRGAAPVVGGLVAVLLAFSLACAPAVPAAPAGTTDAGAKAKTGAPAVASPTAEKPVWQTQWDETLAAAKQEGKIVVSGQASETWRELLTSFGTDYPEIAVEYLGQPSRDFFPRLKREREVGEFAFDVRIGGTDVAAWTAKADGTFDPVRPLLLLPEVTDDSAWAGGLTFLDNQDEYVLAFVGNSSGRLDVNRDCVPEAEFSSMEQLLDPRWKGQIVLQDPRGGGAGQLTLAAMYLGYGEQFVRDLLTNQDVVITRDNRQSAEWIVRCRYPLGVAGGATYYEPFWREGVGENIAPIEGKVKVVSSSSGTIQLINRRPHPNATTIFVNWLLTPAVQTRMAQIVKQNSRRIDVERGHPKEAVDLARMDEYTSLNHERYFPDLIRASEIAKELIK